MLQSINFSTARNTLAAVMDSVSQGEPVTVTRRSARPVVIVDAELFDKLQQAQAEKDFDWLFAEHGETLQALKNR